jgi:hypothetical protein
MPHSLTSLHAGLLKLALPTRIYVGTCTGEGGCGLLEPIHGSRLGRSTAMIRLLVVEMARGARKSGDQMEGASRAPMWHRMWHRKL